MPLNPVDKMESPVTYYYDEDGARDWADLIKYCPRKLNHQGKIDPNGGLVDILYKRGSMTNTSITMIQFRPARENDMCRYKRMSPKVYDGERWVRVSEYVQSQKCGWCKTNPALMDRAGGHMEDRPQETNHHGEFPITANDFPVIRFD